jgi:SpoVK/Ycf46/Vps4 family AAA+-type ATPase
LSTDHWSPKTNRQNIILDVLKPTRLEQSTLWQASLSLNANQLNGELDKLVSQFNMSAKTISDVATELREDGKQNIDRDTNEYKKELWKLCIKHSSPDVNELAHRIEPAASWDDIVLPEAQKDILREIAIQVKHRKKVYDDWGFAGTGSRGLGISAMFTGESGTGKTMAAEVLANELNLDLYRIDLSQVVNKYIGETEKNLKRIFDAAEGGGAILLFDEADALFGKRSEVKDSHDRYGNIEVSYLLQRMEAYRGLAILTTNMKNSLDKAFLRRIRFVVQFPFPGIAQRIEIWGKVFPYNTPTDNLDLEKLAKFSLPGGNIRNIAMNAAFIAADENLPVGMSQILRAAKSEYNKLEKAMNNIEIENI